MKGKTETIEKKSEVLWSRWENVKNQIVNKIKNNNHYIERKENDLKEIIILEDMLQNIISIIW